MSSFTMYLKEITGEDEEPDFTKIGLDSYPIYDEAYRATLNNKIFDQFMNREIGQETSMMFRLAMRRWMNNNMPYFNEQYRLSLLAVDPLSTVSMSSITDSTGTNTSNGQSSNTGNVVSTSETLGSQYPQTMITPDGNYGTDGNKAGATTDSSGGATETQSSNQDGKVENNVKGYQGHAPSLIFQARAAIINIDLLILEGIENAGIFFMLWNNGDEFTEGTQYSVY